MQLVFLDMVQITLLHLVIHLYLKQSVLLNPHIFGEIIHILDWLVVLFVLSILALLIKKVGCFMLLMFGIEHLMILIQIYAKNHIFIKRLDHLKE